MRVGLGALLLATAGLKLYGLSASSVPSVGWFAQPWVQLLAAEWEQVLGAWLLSGVYPRLSWLAALATFIAFAGVSGYLGWVGVASCGCLGAIKTNPWWMFVADVTAAVMLVVCRPSVEGSEPSQFLRTSGMWAGSGAIALAIATAVAVWVFGSPEAALARLRGETLIATDLDLGTGQPGDLLEAPATVRNVTDRPIRLVGGSSDCTCTVLNDLPLTIEPRGSAVVGVHLRIPAATTGQFTRTVLLRTDDPSQPVVRFTIGCRVE